MPTSTTSLPLSLVQKYNRPGPRYTSYPTAPHFTDAFGADDLVATARTTEAGALSLYVHLPFCRSLCYYCGCHMMVTHRPEKIAAYLRYVEREMDLVAGLLPGDRPVMQVHWGGGTPTYLEPGQIEALMGAIRQRFAVHPDAEVSIEADPRGLTTAHLEAARRAGFNRISFGVQDFHPAVQEAINRIQPVDLVARCTEEARALGFEGVSYDLIYGLPHQTEEAFAETVDQVIDLAPDRISVFSYAHVPWMKKHQNVIEPAWLPEPGTKLRLLLQTTEQLTTKGGYTFIGMDHFARPDDALAEAQRAGTMQRNFQGYSTHAGSALYGFGISSISQLPDAYAQNVLDLKSYYAALDADRLPTRRGYRLTEDDHLRRAVIMELMCDFALDVPRVEERFGIDFAATFADALDALAPMAEDDLLTITPEALRVTERGRYLIRNIAMPFDAYLKERSDRPTYSKTV